LDASTVIKIMVGGGVASETDAIETVQYSAEEIQAITSTCKQMGNKHTTAHAYVSRSASLASCTAIDLDVTCPSDC
jgi:imidazolonepropionase-like amidohydrolase